jgi:hypothetical protein
MAGRKRETKKTNEILESEANQMESIMAMLRSQIDEERAKVRPAGSRWTAGAEGPIGKFDAHGDLARRILSKKRRPTAKDASPRRRPDSTIDVVVEPQGGRLWGQFPDSSVQPDGPAHGGSLSCAMPDEAEDVTRVGGNDHEEEEEQPPTGGALWGPPPDEAEEQLEFQREVARLRGEPPAPAKVECEEQGVGGSIVERTRMPPTAFTYFDFLVTKDILDGSSHMPS